VGGHHLQCASSRTIAISTGMIAGDGKSSRGEKFSKRVTLECLDVSRVRHDLRRGRSPQVAAEEVGRGCWTLTGDRTGVKNAEPGEVVEERIMAPRGRLPGRGSRQGSRAQEGESPVDGYRLMSREGILRESTRDLWTIGGTSCPGCGFSIFSQPRSISGSPSLRLLRDENHGVRQR
jgi:hypothetical protein